MGWDRERAVRKYTDKRWKGKVDNEAGGDNGNEHY